MIKPITEIKIFESLDNLYGEKIAHIDDIVYEIIKAIGRIGIEVEIKKDIPINEDLQVITTKNFLNSLRAYDNRLGIIISNLEKIKIGLNELV